MHIHILGICGTFMGGIAAIAQSLGHKVTGSDQQVYPPMSDQLETLGIELTQGYDPDQLSPQPDIVIIGNALSRGNPAVEYVLDHNLNYTSGPQWLLDNVLKDKWVLAVAGTHGKTTTSSMLTWILEYAQMKPGFLIGGIAQNFSCSARLGESDFFVIEADEYDTAFFDKRSKFVHYRPHTLILNNLEFDHADIFDDLSDIQRQCHHMIRMVPANGLILAPASEQAIEDTLVMGCWTATERLGLQWQIRDVSDSGQRFDVYFNDECEGQINWSLQGAHNRHNAVMAIAAAKHVGVSPKIAIEALSIFKNVKRRMELRGTVNQITVYDDFAHHPTAIATTLNGLREGRRKGRILAVLEPRSNTMKMGVHQSSLVDSWQAADKVYVYGQEGLSWDLPELCQHSDTPADYFSDLQALIDTITEQAMPDDQIVIMSNGGFGNIHQRLLHQLTNQKCEL